VSAPTADKLNSTAGTCAARPASPNAPAHSRSQVYTQGAGTGALAVHPRSQACAQGAVTGAVGSLYPVTL